MNFDPNSEQEIDNNAEFYPDAGNDNEYIQGQDVEYSAVEADYPQPYENVYHGHFAAEPDSYTDVPVQEQTDAVYPEQEYSYEEQPQNLYTDEVNEQEEVVPEEQLVMTPVFDETQSFFDDTLQPEILEPAEEPLGAEYGEEMPMTPPVRKKKKKSKLVKKGRPRRKKGEGLLGIPNILVTLVWCALTLLISFTLGRMVWVCAAEVLAFGREDKTVSITVYENDSIEDVTKKLARAGLIRYPGLFRLYAQFAVDEGEIHPGMWDLNTKYDYHALVKMMSPSSSRDVVKVMIPEGYTCRQIFALLEENKVCTSQDIAAYAANGELNDYWFLNGVARGNKYCLEGFLFPDTYEFYKNDSPKNILTKMLNNFDNRFDEDLQYKIQSLNAHLTDLMRRDGKNQDYINSHLFTVKDVVNVASMIEKETSSVQEGYTIASVIYNRLFCWHGNPPFLNIDATIIYALDGKTDLTAEDLRVNSPYNTYLNQGMTPGPISNPGLASLKAALEPSDTNYYFYVLDPAAGSHIFATTQAEHDANRAKVGG